MSTRVKKIQSCQKSRPLARAAIPALSLLYGVSLAQSASAQSSVEALQEFSLDQVQVTDSYQQNLFTKDVNYLVTAIDADRLLNGFRAVSYTGRRSFRRTPG